MANIYNGFLGLIKYWDIFDYLADSLLVTKCMAGQRHLHRLHYMTLRPKQNGMVQILGFLGSENGGKMLHQNVGSFTQLYFLTSETIGRKSFQYLVTVYL